MSLADLHSLVLQAPLSQLPSVLTDIRGLLSASSSSGANPSLAQQFEESLPGLLRRFHEEQGKVIRLPGIEDGSIIAAEAAEEIEDGTGSNNSAAEAGSTDASTPPSDHAYRDAAKCKRFTLNHLTSTSTSSETYRPTPLSENDLRSDIDEHLQAYLRDHYPELDKQRVDQGACGQVWHVPARKLKVIWSKVVEDEPQKTTQEEAMAEKLEEDKEERGGAEQGETDASSSNEIDKETYGGESAQQEHGAQSLETTATKEIRPKAAYDEQGPEEHGELVEQPDLLNPNETERYVIRIVSGKSNASNFWSGRLLSTYVYTPSEGSLDATLKLQIHYYENGNVQLNTLSDTRITLDASVTPSAKSIVAAIRKYEASYQDLLEDTYASLNEKAFKSLRRVLPVTRQKVDWDKVLNYRLGSDLAEAQAGA